MKDKKIRKKLVDTLVEAFELDRNRKTTDQYTVILSHSTSVDQESDNLLEHMLELNTKFKEQIPRLEKIVNEFDFTEK
jgi:hypothetical protein